MPIKWFLIVPILEHRPHQSSLLFFNSIGTKSDLIPQISVMKQTLLHCVILLYSSTHLTAIWDHAIFFHYWFYTLFYYLMSDSTVFSDHLTLGVKNSVIYLFFKYTLTFLELTWVYWSASIVFIWFFSCYRIY